MLRYDKDRERVMQAKKREVVAELEAQKQDAIKEMYEVLEIIMGKMQGLLADYNHIRLTIDERFEAVLKGSEDAIEETNEKVNEHLIRIENEANEKFANVDNTLNEKITSFTSTINGKIEELEALQTVVTELKNQCENMLDGTATEEDLAELEARVTELMESAGVQSDWNESDETSKAFIHNKPFYKLSTTEYTLLDLNIGYMSSYGEWNRQAYTNGDLTNWNVYDEVEILLTDKNTEEEYYHYIGKLDGRQAVIDLPAPAGDIKCHMWHEYDDGENFHIQVYWDDNKNNPACRFTSSIYCNLKVFYKTVAYERPDPWMFGDEATNSKYLYLDKNKNLRWAKDLYIESSSGNKFKLTVSDDGTITTEAVTE